MIALGLLATGFAMVYWLLYLLWYVLEVVALWCVFTKAGVAGWKSLIPLYNVYCLFRISWKNGNAALLYVAATVLAWIFGRFNGGFWGVLNWICAVAAGLLYLANCLKEAKAFEKGTLFGLGLWLLGPIFHMILGFGPARYRGAQA